MLTVEAPAVQLTWLRRAEGQLERGQPRGAAGERERVVIVEHDHHSLIQSP